jgi:leader peptidase (prepilin peptidase)/N-methyltransferase
MTIARWVFPVLVAPFAGSLAAVLAQRLSRGAPVVMARSACDSCRAQLGVRDLVPLFSYTALRGSCRSCGARIGLAEPLMELAAVGLAAWAASVNDSDALWASCALGWMLLAISVCDAMSLRVPDALTMPLLLMGLVATWWLDPVVLVDHTAAAALGYAAAHGFDGLYYMLRGRHGLGGGDAKLLAASGSWLGIAALLQVVTAASITGLLIVCVMVARGERPTGKTVLPFGPCLAVATWLVWLYW